MDPDTQNKLKSQTPVDSKSRDVEGGLSFSLKNSTSSKSLQGRSQKSKVEPSKTSTPDDDCESDRDEVLQIFGDEDDDSSNSEEDGVPFEPKSMPDPKEIMGQGKRIHKSNPSQQAESSTGVVFLGHIPHGFYEDEMRSYFSQFGQVTRLRLSRQPRSGRSRHYGFIEFQIPDVAAIVAETLDGYLLCGRILSCKVLSKDQIHPKLWIGCNKRFRRDWKPRLARKKHNQEKTPEQQSAIAKRLIKREERKRKRFEELGIQYDFRGYCTPRPTAVKPKALERKKQSVFEKKKALKSPLILKEDNLAVPEDDQKARPKKSAVKDKQKKKLKVSN